MSGTPVLTENGLAAIEDVCAGDMVWATDPETGEVALKRVICTFINETDELVHVHVNGEEIVCTPEHPFYSPVFGWTAAIHLRAGDILVLVNGEYAVVEQVQHEILEAPTKVYNFEVEGFHTYYVGADGVLVHNICVTQTISAATGQAHHPISRKIERAARQNDNLSKVVTRDKWGTIRALTPESHRGYQRWHRSFDNDTVSWLKDHPYATESDFITFMNDLYGSADSISRFGIVVFS